MVALKESPHEVLQLSAVNGMCCRSSGHSGRGELWEGVRKWGKEATFAENPGRRDGWTLRYIGALNSQDTSGKVGLAVPGARREKRGSERQADLPEPTRVLIFEPRSGNQIPGHPTTATKVHICTVTPRRRGCFFSKG